MAKNRTRATDRKMRHRRVRKKIFGTPKKPRLNVFRSSNQIYAQLIDDFNGHTLASASTIDSELRSELEDLSKTERAKRVGLAIAERAQAIGVKQVVFDRGGFRYIGRVRALADGAREGGLQF
jgi:large subunit ribosomal protein L18